MSRAEFKLYAVVKLCECVCVWVCLKGTMSEMDRMVKPACARVCMCVHVCIFPTLTLLIATGPGDCTILTTKATVSRTPPWEANSSLGMFGTYSRCNCIQFVSNWEEKEQGHKLKTLRVFIFQLANKGRLAVCFFLSRTCGYVGKSSLCVCV